MECLVFARKMSAIDLNSPLDLKKLDRSIESCDIQDPHEEHISKHTSKIDELRKSCWRNLGVSRNKNDMLLFLNILHGEIDQLKNNTLLNILGKIEIDKIIKLNESNRRGLNVLIDLQNRQITSLILSKACLYREESRGGHYRVDFHSKEKNWECHTRQQLGQEIKKRFIKN